jgi:hypothetical protein
MCYDNEGRDGVHEVFGREFVPGHVKPRRREESADEDTRTHRHGSRPGEQECTDCFRAPEANEQTVLFRESAVDVEDALHRDDQRESQV